MPLARMLADAAGGLFPPADGSVTVVPQPAPRDAGVIAFTAHCVVFADVDPEVVRGLLAPATCRRRSVRPSSPRCAGCWTARWTPWTC